MEHESFEDEETARLMNERFVCVKVDREERPDVDGLYMEAVVSLTGHGGWPMTVFLTPDGRPFFGGTYFPPEPRFNMPSFPQVLLAVSEAYASGAGSSSSQADPIVDAIRQGSERRPSNEPLTTELLVRAVSALARAVRPRARRLRRRAEVPAASTLEFLLRTGRDDALEMVAKTLDEMAAGGMYDLVGGGFHRYSVDERWLVPHFEKMLYDNALLAATYLHAWLVTGEDALPPVVEETLDYIGPRDASARGRLRLRAGRGHGRRRGPHLHVDAEEVEDVLGEPHPEWLQPFEHGRFVIRGDVPAEAAERLLATREKRPQPVRDDKALAAWNGWRSAAFAEAGRALGRPDYLEVARRPRGVPARAAERRPTGGLFRTYRDGVAKIDGYLEDYANVANGLLELHWATGDLRWLEEARRLAAVLVELFADPERGGFFVDATRRSRRAPQGVRRPPHAVRELDDRLRPASPRAHLRRRRARAPRRRRLSSRAPYSRARAPPSGTSSARSTSTSRRRARSPSSGESEELRARRCPGSSRTRSSPSPTSRRTPCRSSPARASSDGKPGRLRLRTNQSPNPPAPGPGPGRYR